jgi:hypothetical protein
MLSPAPFRDGIMRAGERAKKSILQSEFPKKIIVAV